jgi:xanthine dehydrogenase large subunit
MKAVGKPLPHESAVGHVTGKALYTDDLLVRYPGLLHAWPVLAPHAHARLLHLHTEPALSAPGVITVLTAADIPGQNDTGANRHDEPLLPSEVLYHSQPVAWVLAESEEAARQGAALVKAEYEPLPAILTLEEAMAEGSFHSGPLRMSRGEVESALHSSPYTLQGQLELGAQEHFYLETHASIAHVDEAGTFMVQSSTQHPSETQEVVARVLGVERNQVVVQCLRMGGGFGGKEVQANPWAAVAALGARKTGRPVRVRLMRHLDMALTGKRHPFLGRFEVGFNGSGQLLALRIALYSDGGWSLDLSDPVLGRALFHVDNAYFIPHLEATGYVCKTHKTSQTAFRGFGGPQGMVMIEEVLSRVARRLGLEPEQVRERNFYREGHTTHYGQPVKDASRLHTLWSELQQSAAFQERQAAVRAFNASHPYRKRALGMTPVKFGISFTFTPFNQGGALVLVYRDGSVQVNHGGTEMGQGLHTKVLQIAAHTLGLPLERIRIMPTRTDKVPNTSATAASAGTDLNGAAVKNACETLKERLTPVAAELLGCPEPAVRFEEGQVFPEGSPLRALPFAQVVDAAWHRRIPLSAQGFYRTPEIHFDRAKGQGRPFHYFSYGAAVAEVEVEGFTGEYRLLRVDIAHDVGESLSPLVDKGQVEGGFFQGLGWLTLEEVVWDKHGRLATQGPSTYKLPSWSELPEAFNVRFLERAAEPGVVYGSKAVGEPPLMLALCVREALKEAVAAFGPGPVELASPATPEQVYWAIERVRGARPGELPRLLPTLRVMENGEQQ